VIVPRHPGVAAAFGLLLSDLRHDVRRSWLRPTAEVKPAELDAALASLVGRARGLAARAAHGGDAALRFELDMRYRGQAYNLTVPLAAPPVTPASLAGAEEAFAALHERTYGYRHGLGETEIVTLRVTASATAPTVDWAAEAAAVAEGRTTLRDVWTAGRPVAHRVLHRSALGAGDAVRGPALVEQEDTTLVVPAGWRGVCAAAGTLVLRREEG
jgi:N-methylhydantoinase A